MIYLAGLTRATWSIWSCLTAKAFDVVSHPILLEKLSLLGVDASLISWVEVFLTRRTMSVSIKGKVSCPHAVGSGVPQGSVLGPILFLIFVNHIAATLLCEYKIFADDLKMYLKLSHTDHACYQTNTHRAQQDIDSLLRIASSWGLRVNESKCAIMRFKRRFHDFPAPEYVIASSPIPYVSSHTDLGVLVDSDLKFHCHISRTSKRSAALALNVLKSTACRSPEFMMPIFSTHIRPIMEYCSCLWNTGYIGDVRALESVQRLWTKQVSGLRDMDYGTRLKELNQYSVFGRLLRADLIYYWKLFHGKCALTPSDLFTTSCYQGTRGHRFKVNVPRSVTDIRRRSFAVRSIVAWNQLPDDVVATANLTLFKQKLANTLGDSLFAYYQ